MAIVTNPVLPGFHPDPCIIRHNEWFYIVTSTFEWWPGVQINRSRDLVQWEIAGYALTRKSQLDLRGVPDSGGVWAPALSFHDGLFWLVYSDMKSFSGPFKDVRNYLVTAEQIEGPWSDPVLLNSSGFDPSLFHDDDGKKWLLNQLWNPTHDRSSFAGIVMQEYSPSDQRLIGDVHTIFAGSSLGTTEGPHLYRKDGFYYLLTAEAGTSWEHAVTVARSSTLFGPYELSPHHPLLTSAQSPTAQLQKAGHGSLAQDANGCWYLAHLCSRPVPGTRRCILGRETALQPIHWPAGDWPRLAVGGSTPQERFEINGTNGQHQLGSITDNFQGSTLALHWNSLREPISSDWLSLTEQPGSLRLYGRHSIQSLFDHSMVGLRVAHLSCDVHVTLEFTPRNLRQRAGLAFYYNSTNFYYLFVSFDQDRRFVNVLTCDNDRYVEDSLSTVVIPASGPVQLHGSLRNERLTFFCRVGDAPSVRVGEGLDATTLSDDYPLESKGSWAFTGLFAALCAQDATGNRTPADFSRFTYRPAPSP